MPPHPERLPRGVMVYLKPPRLDLPGGWYRVVSVRDDYIKVERSHELPVELTHQRFQNLQTDPPGAEFGEGEGVLRAMGYAVGRNGVRLQARRDLLQRVVATRFGQLPEVSNVAEWGESNTLQRVDKIGRCLAGFIQNARRRTPPPQAAIDAWEKDLEWFEEHFGRQHNLKWSPPEPFRLP